MTSGDLGFLLDIEIPHLGRSATEAQLGLADEFEFEFDLKFDDRVRIRVSSSGFWVIVSVSSLEYPFGDPFSVPFRVHLGTHFRSLWGPIFGSIWGPIWGPKKTTLCNKSIISIAWGIARGNGGLLPSTDIAQSPSHSLSHPSDGFATTSARRPLRASVMFILRQK